MMLSLAIIKARERETTKTEIVYGMKNERKSVVSLSIVLLLLNLPYLVELGAEGVYLGH